MAFHNRKSRRKWSLTCYFSAASFLLLLLVPSITRRTHAFPSHSYWKAQGPRRNSSSHFDLFMTLKDTSNAKFLSRRTFGPLTASIVGLVAAGEGYARVASLNIQDEKVTLQPNILLDDVKQVTIIFHGAGGPDEYTDALVETLKRNASHGKIIIAMVEWQDYSSNLLQASANGKVVGRKIAQRILDSSCLERIHVVGISVGAFAADSLCTTIKQQRPCVYIQETLLDPFQQSGIVDVSYGKRNFGKYADYAQQFLNTDDPVPFTNEPLPHCVTYNVTSLRPSDIFGHDWPVAYYSQSSSSSTLAGFVADKDQLKRGTLVQVYTR